MSAEEAHEALTIDRVFSTSAQYLRACGFNAEEAECISRNLVEAELAGKTSHGIIRLRDYRAQCAAGKIRTGTSELRIAGEQSDFLFFDAQRQSASVAVYRSLERALEKMGAGESMGADAGEKASAGAVGKMSEAGAEMNAGEKTSAETGAGAKRNVCVVGIRDMAYASGFIGDYARVASEAGYIFISFFNSPAALIPHGSSQAQWGTNPISFAFPGTDVIYDSASSAITWGELMYARKHGEEIPNGLALGADGEPTQSPADAMKGGILSMGGHKGSGLGLMVEIMAGALTGSLVGGVVPGGWGGLYILIRPNIFQGDVSGGRAGVESGGRGASAESGGDNKPGENHPHPRVNPIHDTKLLLNALKNSPKRSGFNEIFFPGERSSALRQKALEAGRIRISKPLWESVLGDLGEL